MHTSPDHDARLLPWIDAVGSLPGDESGSRTRLLSERRQRLAGSSPALAADEQVGYDRLLACLLHDDDVRCEVCRDDQT